VEDIQRINDQLRDYPEAIYKATTRTEELRETWQLVEARKDYETARAYLVFKANNTTEGQAKAHAEEEVYETAREAIMAESAYRRALADQIRLENEFTGIRKRAELLKLTEAHMRTAA
jgi:hypothetical protein